MLTVRRTSYVFGLIGLFLAGGLLGGCSSSEPVIGRDVDRRVYLVRGERVDEPPEIVGGYAEVERVKNYPPAAEKDQAYGVIWLQATITASGTATRLELAKGGHPALETEALNVVRQLDFRPAKKNGSPIQSRIQIPIIFQGPYAAPEKEEKKDE